MKAVVPTLGLESITVQLPQVQGLMRGFGGWCVLLLYSGAGHVSVQFVKSHRAVCFIFIRGCGYRWRLCFNKEIQIFFFLKAY